MSVTSPVYVNTTTTTSACTFYGGPSCVVEFKPAFAYWGPALLVTTNPTTTQIITSSALAPIATTRYFVDPASNRTVSSSVICNWSLYESDYYNEGTTTTNPDSYPSSQPGYYTVNSQCSLLGVFPGLLDNNGTWHHLTATYPNTLIDLGNTIRITTRACPSATRSIITTSVTYTGDFSSYIAAYNPSGASGVDLSTSVEFPFWTFPELTNYLSDIPELSSCSISLGGSPATLRGATYLTENVVLPRTTQASSTQAKQPAPDSSTAAPSSSEPEPASSTPASPVSRPDLIRTSSAAPATSPTQPGGSTQPGNDDSPSGNEPAADDSTPSPTDDDEQSAPINQDPIWSAIGEVGQDESDETPSSSDGSTNDSGGSQGADTSTSDSSQGTNGPEDDTPVSGADQSASGSDDSASSPDTSSSGNSQGTADSTGSGNSNGGTDAAGSQAISSPAGVVVTVTSSGTPVAFTVVPSNDDSEEAVQSFVAANEASVEGNALVTGTQTIEAGGPAVTISNNGQIQALGVPAPSQEPVVVVTATDTSGQQATVTLAAGSAADQNAVQSIVSAQGAALGGNNIVIGSQTLQPGGPAVTVSQGEATQVLSLPTLTAGSPVIVTATDSNGQGVAVTLAAEGAVIPAAVQALVLGNSARYEDGTLVIGTQTLVPGGSAVTLAGSDYTGAVSLPASIPDDIISVSIAAGEDETQAITIASDGDLGDDAVQSLLSANDAHVTEGALVVGTQTLTAGGAGITLTEDDRTQVISLPARTPTTGVSGPLTIGSQVVYPGGSPITITSNGRTEIISLPTLVSGSSGLVSSVVVANASSTATQDIGDYICSVMGSCPTAADETSTRSLVVGATATDAEPTEPTGAAGEAYAWSRMLWALTAVAVTFLGLV